MVERIAGYCTLCRSRCGSITVVDNGRLACGVSISLLKLFASPPTVPKTLTPQAVHIAGSDKSSVWAPELGSILDAAEAAGFALPSGCRVGQCESCAMRIVDGSIARLAAEDGETDQCLTCQAVPLSELTLAL